MSMFLTSDKETYSADVDNSPKFDKMCTEHIYQHDEMFALK